MGQISTIMRIMPNRINQITETLNMLNEADNNNLQANETWGETITYKEENTCRIHFHNIRNLTVDDDWQLWTDMLEKMKMNNVDIFGFVEPNINWTTKLNIEAAKVGRRINKQQFIMQTSTSEEYSESHNKRGGTLLCATNRMTGSFATMTNGNRGRICN